MNPDAIARVRSKLAALKRTNVPTFGSDLHRYELKPPASEEVLEAFEREHRIALPEDYRLFLSRAGNGGAGPYYGILPLEDWDAKGMDDIEGLLSRPSPLRPGMPAGVPWEEALGCAWEELYQGALAVCHQGCAYYALLIVTGDYRGRIVYINADEADTPYFVADPNFLSWYERWEDDLMAGWDCTWFGFGTPGTVEELIDIVTASSDPALRTEALTSLRRVPDRDRRVIEVARGCLTDPDHRVREMARAVLHRLEQL
jgi:hypothetical protein